MLKNIITVILAGLMFTFAMAGNASALDEKMRREFEALYDRIDKLTVARDMKSLEKFIAADFKTVRDGKEFDRAAEIKYQQEMNEKVGTIHRAETVIDEIEMNDKGEVVLATTQKVIFSLPNDAKKHEATSKSIEVWAKTKEGWQIVSHAPDSNEE